MKLTGNEEKKAHYYDDIYKSGYNTHNYYYLYQEILKILNTIPMPQILELGCGIGDLGKMIVEQGYPYKGFDFSEEAVRICKDRCPTGDFFVGNIYDKNLYDNLDYNTVISLEVLEHVDDITVIKNLKSGSRLIASVPDYDDLSHLRLYKDPQIDIIEHFKPYLKVFEVNSAKVYNQNTQKTQTLHLFQAFRETD